MSNYLERLSRGLVDETAKLRIGGKGKDITWELNTNQFQTISSNPISYTGYQGLTASGGYSPETISVNPNYYTESSHTHTLESIFTTSNTWQPVYGAKEGSTWKYEGGNWTEVIDA